VLYFDHNATSPLCETAKEAWLDASARYPGNPSSPHRLGARADAALAQAREKLAGWLGCDPAEIVWTAGATEANNTVLHHAAQTTSGEAWISAIEHPCVLESTRRHFPKRHRLIPATPDGVLDLAWLERSLKDHSPSLVAVMAANNETGVLQPCREAMALCRERGVSFFCDAAQWIGKLPAIGLGDADFVSGCAHKFGGPQGVGFLKGPQTLRPLLLGGPQEDGRRAGTENVAGILSMIAALDLREQTLKEGAAAERTAWRTEFEEALIRELPGAQILGASVPLAPSVPSVPSAHVSGAGAPRLWNTVSAIMPELPDCRQRWVVKLDSLGFAVSTGSACASGKEQTSHVLAAMGLPASTASRALRFSSGWETKRSDWQGLLDGLRRAHAALAN
jgi:cysteine desulfurase